MVNNNVEQLLIALLLQKKEDIELAYGITTPDKYFENKTYARIFVGILKAHKNNKELNLLQLSNDLRIPDVYALLLNLSNLPIDKSVTVSNCIKVIENSFVRKESIGLVNKLQTDLSNVDVDNIGEELVKVQSVLQDYSSKLSLTGLEKFAELVSEYYEDTRSPTQCIPTGFQNLDDLLEGGLHFKKLSFIAGRPGMGKTSFVISIIVHTLMNSNRPVVLFNLEMSNSEIVARIISNITKIPFKKLNKHDLTPSEEFAESEAIKLLSKKELYLYDGEISPAKVREFLYKANLEKPLVIIDYIQLMFTERQYPNKNNQMEAISRELKLLAKSYVASMVVLAQLNREVEKRQDKRPMLSDLRDSGGLEQDADQVLLIYRDGAYNVDSEMGNIAEIHVAKHRQGATGVAELLWDGPTTSFLPIESNKITLPEC